MMHSVRGPTADPWRDTYMYLAALVRFSLTKMLVVSMGGNLNECSVFKVQSRDI
jgi:hypothetical protein